MNVEGFFDLFFSFWQGLFNVLNSHHISAFGVSVSLSSILFTVIVLSMVISIFWKGAQG